MLSLFFSLSELLQSNIDGVQLLCMSIQLLGNFLQRMGMVVSSNFEIRDRFIDVRRRTGFNHGAGKRVLIPNVKCLVDQKIKERKENE